MSGSNLYPEYPDHTYTTTTTDATRYCQWCGHGIIHNGMCPRVKSIQYDQYGIIVKVEFFPPQNA